MTCWTRLIALSLLAAACGDVRPSPSDDDPAEVDGPAVDADAPLADAPLADAPLADAALADAPSPIDARPPIDAPPPLDAPPPTATLAVQRNLPAGTAGTVTSSPAGISCGADCTQVYPAGTAVTLTAAAGTNTVFDRWSGGCTGTALTCTTTMSANRTVSADFRTRFTLTLSVEDLGNAAGGRVRVSPPDQLCNGGTCTLHYAAATAVTLTALEAPADCLQFDRWGGACSGTSLTCSLQMNTARTVDATFVRPTGCIPP